jgi:hypothetical protein
MTTFGPRKRNGKCRNKVCACTGACWDDTTSPSVRKPTGRSIIIEVDALAISKALELADEP